MKVFIDVEEIDLETADVFRARVHEAMSRAAGEEDVALDFTSVRFIDSAGIGVLVGAMKSSRRDGQRLRVVNATDHVADVLAVTGISDLLGGASPTV